MPVNTAPTGPSLVSPVMCARCWLTWLLLGGTWCAIAMGEPAVVDRDRVVAHASDAAPASAEPAGSLPSELRRLWRSLCSDDAVATVIHRATAVHRQGSRRPVRVLELVTGERWCVEVVAADARGVAVRFPSGWRARLPRSAVASLGNPARLLDVWDIPGPLAEIDPLPPIVAPIETGVIQVWASSTTTPSATATSAVKDETAPEVPTSVAVTWELTFLTDAGVPAAVTFTHSPEVGWSYALPDDWTHSFRQPVRQRHPRLEVRWTPDDWSILIGNTPAITGNRALVGLVDWRIVDGDPQRLGDLVLRRRDQADEANWQPADVTQDVLLLADGSELYGEFLGLDSHTWAWQTDGGARLQVPWPEVRRCVARLNWQSPWVGQPLRGEIVTVTRPETGGDFGLPEERWFAALQRTAAGDPQALTHTLLMGRLPLPDSARITTLHRGERHWLLPPQVHLGDEIRPDMTPALPQATRLSGRFRLSALPRGAVQVTAEVADLEPSGLRTLRTQPFLEQLRQGHLLTEFWLNGERIGDWNRLLDYRPPVAHPARLQLPIPREHLRIGENQWEIRTIPDPTTRFIDDLTLRRLALDVIDEATP